MKENVACTTRRWHRWWGEEGWKEIEKLERVYREYM